MGNPKWFTVKKLHTDENQLTKLQNIPKRSWKPG